MDEKLKYYLIAITLFSVLCDTMLQPFYPRFFSEAFGVNEPEIVGGYMAAMTAVVMLTFPVWARLAKKTGTLNLLIITQLAAGVFSILTYTSEEQWVFWLLSLSMVMFKASYLLVYPYIMSLEVKSKHSQTIGILSVIVHFGTIGGAVIGGYFLNITDPRTIFLVMSVGDFTQTLVCFYIRHQQKEKPYVKGNEEEAGQGISNRYVLKLALIMLAFYFSAQLTRPFFTEHWEALSGLESPLLAGLAYAIPALIALVALWLNRMLAVEHVLVRLVPSLMLGSAGLMMQGTEHILAVIIGRCLYGWALFQATVRLDVLLYEVSTPEHYAKDFSHIYMFQSIGSLLASFSAGTLVSATHLASPLYLGAFGFVITIGLINLWMIQEKRQSSIKVL